MLALGTVAPDFTLPHVATGRPYSLADFRESKALLVVFLCAHCPYVVHVRPELARIAADYADRGVGTLGITSNDVAQYPGKVKLIATGFGEAATAVNNIAVMLDPSAHLFPGHSSDGS
jgi:thiol-disulfide isomerase/thioredoxin